MVTVHAPLPFFFKVSKALIQLVTCSGEGVNDYVFTGQCYPFEVIFIYNGNDPEQSALILAHRQGNKPDVFFIHDSQRENEMNPERKEFNQIIIQNFEKRRTP